MINVENIVFNTVANTLRDEFSNIFVSGRYRCSFFGSAATWSRWIIPFIMERDSSSLKTMC